MLYVVLRDALCDDGCWLSADITTGYISGDTLSYTLFFYLMIRREKERKQSEFSYGTEHSLQTSHRKRRFPSKNSALVLVENSQRVCYCITILFATSKVLLHSYADSWVCNDRYLGSQHWRHHYPSS